MTETFGVTEVFPTLQGEGRYAGARAVFVRFSGCNMWSGKDATRVRDADRNSNHCARFCDTDFSRKLTLTAQQLIDLVAVATVERPEVVVLTGGEPGLQVTRSLVEKIRGATGAVIAIESNGTVDLSDLGLDWICISPKVAAEHLVQRTGQELKVVFPSYDPADFADLEFHHRYVSPEATPGSASVVEADNMRRAAEWVLDHPGWKLSVQMHKMVGIQ